MRAIFRLSLSLIVACVFSSCASRGPSECGSHNSMLPPALVPDKVFGADFSQACKNHDACYGKLGGTRRDCDRQFRKDVIAAAKETGPLARIPARLSAEIYAIAVRVGGKKAYAEGMIKAMAKKVGAGASGVIRQGGGGDASH